MRRKTMRTALRIAALFAVYAAIGLAGNPGIGLLAEESDATAASTRSNVDHTRAVAVDAQADVVSRVRVGRSADCAFGLDRELTVPAEDVSRLAVDAGSGDLRMEGREGLEEIQVVGRVCADEEGWLDELTISADVVDGEVRLETHYPDRGQWRSGTAHIHLVILMPLGLAVEIDDSSGDMVVSGTGDLRIDDSSGSIDVFDVDGPLTIDDSSGGLDLRRIAGDVRIHDSSGGIDLSSVGGRVDLRDGSGSMEIVDVRGSVVVESDGSGSIDVRDIGGDFVVERDGSGGIRHSGVEGRIDVPRKR